jgi:hypothetical protein
MQITERTSYDVSAEDVFAARCDQGVREQACQQGNAMSWEVRIEPVADGTVRIQVDRQMPPEVPEAFKKFVGDSIQVRQVEQWSAADATGARTAQVKVTIKGQPASMVGTASITPAGSGSTEVLEGDVKVNVPFLGKKFEPDLAKVIVSALKLEQRIGLEWLQGHRG